MAWSEYEKLVLSKLEALDQGHEGLAVAVSVLREELVALRVLVAGELAALKVKAGLWGAGCAVLVVLAELLLRTLK